ncbi:MAG: acetolactate synthase small subunit [Candidatus Levybacteria bacterium]|nr:acetolactate synthase small subunit [Candidatus Levybacteria bacterium]
MNILYPSTITIFSENKPGVLYRIANLFLRRKINIESLTVSEIKSKGLSRFTIVVKEDPKVVEKITRQLAKIIEVSDVYTHNDDSLIFKEIALIKVSVKDQDQLKKIESIAYQFQAPLIHREDSVVVIQKSGSEEDINFLRSVLEKFGIKELVRSGRIALEKGKGQKPKITSNEIKNTSRATGSIDVSIIKKIELLSRSHKDVISLAQGIPSFFTAEHIRQAAKNAIDSNLVDKYTPGYGIPELREAIAEKVKRENNIHARPEEVIVTHGGIEALMAVFMTLLNVEDEIIVPTPDYASHITQIIISTHGGKPIFVPLIEQNKEWVLDVSRLEQAVTTRTKAILLCNPSNPTGKVYSKNELEQVAKIAKKHNLFIITDEMYEHFLYDGRSHISIGSFKGIEDRVISVFGVSKSYAMTGWRIGYIVATKKLIDQIFKVHDSIITCPTAVSQYAALAAITGKQDIVSYYKQSFEKRRKIVVDELAKTNMLSYTMPQGAYYCFPKLKKSVNDVELAIRMIKEAKVGVVPGSPFGLGGENHIRISFGCEEEVLREGLRRLVTYLNTKL